MLQALIGPVAGLAKTWLGNKQQQSQAKHEAKMQVIQNGADWESKMADASASSWKDEFWTIVLAIPAVLVFLPSMSAHIAQGFAVLETMPDWYKAALGVAISAAFGVSKFQQVMNGKKK